ncbi:MAG: 3-isopropylmalate dehydratase small subunit [Alicyclobacillus herbarius]|uniref:3-isopropylmalate dehydratase small subunit n=1 Tax=Alicyclobacillus herbarius TaxID=122960 RepID=UPI0023542F64|nr:3-isopropylmalate dehydratase small subunit [Alicyclobacillus herbarius]MCL6632251.1 3-isopropylmalate dehydratase small subunit [Alicyclobacillus herbarius]
MEPLVRHEGKTAFLDRVNVDTDQIIPKQFLKRIERSGFGQFLFYDWRYLDDGSPNPEFALNQPYYEGASILVARDNFGCGSSREHAAWALADYGIRVILAPSFADIFYNNCFKNGLLPVVLSSEAIQHLFAVGAGHSYHLIVDLENQRVELPDGSQYLFEIDPQRKHKLLHGLDDVGLTLQHEGAIAAYEARRKVAVGR